MLLRQWGREANREQKKKDSVGHLLLADSARPTVPSRLGGKHICPPAHSTQIIVFHSMERPRVASLTEPPLTNSVPAAAGLGDGGDGSRDDSRCGGGGDDGDDDDDRLALLVSAIVGNGLFGSLAEGGFAFPLGTGGFLAGCFLALPRRPAKPPTSAPPPPPPSPSMDDGDTTDVDDGNEADDAGLFLPLSPLIFFALRLSRRLEAFCNVCRPWPVMAISPSRASSATEMSPEARMNHSAVVFSIPCMRVCSPSVQIPSCSKQSSMHFAAKYKKD